MYSDGRGNRVVQEWITHKCSSPDNHALRQQTNKFPRFDIHPYPYPYCTVLVLLSSSSSSSIYTEVRSSVGEYESWSPPKSGGGKGGGKLGEVEDLCVVRTGLVPILVPPALFAVFAAQAPAPAGNSPSCGKRIICDRISR